MRNEDGLAQPHTLTGRTRIAVALAAAVLASGCGALRSGSTTATAQDPDAREWIHLFNGKNLDGWISKIAKHDVGDNYANTFRVVDGVIQARYDGYGGNYNAQFGHLYYERPFSYYILSTDYRFSGELYPGAPSYTLRNSGIMIHSQHPRTMPRDQNFPISIENQLLGGLSDGKARPTSNICTPGTAVTYNGKFDNRHCIPSTSKTYDGDQWVHSETLVLGDSVVKQMVNGDTVLTYTTPQYMLGVVTGFDPAQMHEGRLISSGYVALQAEGHNVDFKNVRLLNLEGCRDATARNYKRYFIKSNPAACRY
ncbi:hypothetical protein BH11GEM1_BH11GEM1_06060 [soil metagenome]